MPIYDGHERVLLAVARAKNGVTFGNGDTNVYRGAANQLKTDDEVVIANGGGKDTLALSSTSADTGITVGGDTNLYREAADILATDDKLHVVGEVEVDGALNHDGTTAGFYGTAPVTKPTALTAADASTVDTTYGTEESNVIANLRTRVGELEAKLQSLGLLS